MKLGLVDIGNTRTKVAIVDAGPNIFSQSLQSEKIFNTKDNLDLSAVQADTWVIGSVVPAKTDYLLSQLQSAGFANEQIHVVTVKSPFQFRISIEQPETVGVDRLLNLEGLDEAGASLVIDAGTATKFDLLEGVKEKNFPGGAIAPGLMLSYEAMVAGAAQLPSIDLTKHSPVVGYNTETAIRSGVLHGFAAMVDGMILKIFEERALPVVTAVVATGGNSKYLQGRARFVSKYDQHLILKGLHKVAKKVFL